MIRTLQRTRTWQPCANVLKTTTLSRQTQIGQHMAFSSSSPSPNTDSNPSIHDSFEGILRYAQRCTDRVAQFEKYQKANVFPPNNFTISNFFLYTNLQLPTNTNIDAIEFLQGAQFACDLVMHTMYSREFVNYSCGAITESPGAEYLKKVLSPNCFDAFVYAMRETSKSGNTFDLKQLDIKGVYLRSAEWERLSLANIKREEVLARRNTEEANSTEGESPSIEKQMAFVETADGTIEPGDEETIVERMRLDVILETTEHLEVTTADGEDQSIAKETTAMWRFESSVTQPEDLDWRIIGVF